jgi:hypothetical protein
MNMLLLYYSEKALNDTHQHLSPVRCHITVPLLLGRSHGCMSTVAVVECRCCVDTIFGAHAFLPTARYEAMCGCDPALVRHHKNFFPKNRHTSIRAPDFGRKKGVQHSNNNRAVRRNRYKAHSCNNDLSLVLVLSARFVLSFHRPISARQS